MIHLCSVIPPQSKRLPWQTAALVLALLHGTVPIMCYVCNWLHTPRRPPPPEARPSDPALTFHPPALGAPFSFAITRSPQGPPQRASQQQATGDHPRMTQSAGSTGGPQGSTKRYSSSSTETGTYSLRPGDGYIAGVTKEGDGGAEKWLSSTGEVGAVQSQTQPPDPPLLDTEGHGLVFKEQYIEFGTAVPQASGLYGLGEPVRRMWQYN